MRGHVERHTARYDGHDILKTAAAAALEHLSRGKSVESIICNGLPVGSSSLVSKKSSWIRLYWETLGKD